MVSIKTIFTNIANAIRTKKGTSAKYLPENMAEEISTIDVGITPSGKIEITNTEEINVTNYETAQIVDSNLTEENIKEGVSILGKVGTFKGSSSESTLKKLLDATKSSYGLFHECDMANINVNDLINYSDTENVTNMSYMFSDCARLATIPQLDGEKLTSVAYTFNNCKSLENFNGIINLGQAYLTTQSANYSNYRLVLLSSTKLTEQSIINILNNLYDIKTKGCNTQQVILGSDNLAKLTSEEGQTALTNATAKGWTIS